MDFFYFSEFTSVPTAGGKTITVAAFSLLQIRRDVFTNFWRLINASPHQVNLQFYVRTSNHTIGANFSSLKIGKNTKPIKFGPIYNWTSLDKILKSISFWISDLVYNNSRVAQWKRAGPITQRSVDRNYALLVNYFFQIHRSDFILLWNLTTAQ